MPKIECVIISLDGKGNIIKHKQQNFHSMHKGEFCYKPLKKGEYNRAEIAEELKKLEQEDLEPEI